MNFIIGHINMFDANQTIEILHVGGARETFDTNMVNIAEDISNLFMTTSGEKKIILTGGSKSYYASLLPEIKEYCLSKFNISDVEIEVM